MCVCVDWLLLQATALLPRASLVMAAMLVVRGLLGGNRSVGSVVKGRANTTLPPRVSVAPGLSVLTPPPPPRSP